MVIKIFLFILFFIIKSTANGMSSQLKNINTNLIESKIKKILLTKQIKEIIDPTDKEKQKNIENFKKAMKTFDYNIIKKCLDSGVDANTLIGKTPPLLHIYYTADNDDKFKTIKLLIEKNADIGVVDEKGLSILWYIVQSTNVNNVNELFEVIKNRQNENDKKTIKNLLFKKATHISFLSAYEKLSPLDSYSIYASGYENILQILQFIDENSSKELKNLKKNNNTNEYWLTNEYTLLKEKLVPVYGKYKTFRILDILLGDFKKYYEGILETFHTKLKNINKKNCFFHIPGNIHTLLAFNSFPEFLKLIDESTLKSLNSEALPQIEKEKINISCLKEKNSENFVTVDKIIGERLRQMMTQLYPFIENDIDWEKLFSKYKEMSEAYKNIIQFIENIEATEDSSLKNLNISILFEKTGSADVGGVTRNLINAFCELLFLSKDSNFALFTKGNLLNENKFALLKKKRNDLWIIRSCEILGKLLFISIKLMSSDYIININNIIGFWTNINPGIFALLFEVHENLFLSEEKLTEKNFESHFNLCKKFFPDIKLIDVDFSKDLQIIKNKIKKIYEEILSYKDTDVPNEISDATDKFSIYNFFFKDQIKLLLPSQNALEAIKKGFYDLVKKYKKKDGDEVDIKEVMKEINPFNIERIFWGRSVSIDQIDLTYQYAWNVYNETYSCNKENSVHQCINYYKSENPDLNQITSKFFDVIKKNEILEEIKKHQAAISYFKNSINEWLQNEGNLENFVLSLSGSRFVKFGQEMRIKFNCNIGKSKNIPEEEIKSKKETDGSFIISHTCNHFADVFITNIINFHNNINPTENLNDTIKQTFGDFESQINISEQ
jgi:hypothetical protein